MTSIKNKYVYSVEVEHEGKHICLCVLGRRGFNSRCQQHLKKEKDADRAGCKGGKVSRWICVCVCVCVCVRERERERERKTERERERERKKERKTGERERKRERKNGERHWEGRKTPTLTHACTHSFILPSLFKPRLQLYPNNDWMDTNKLWRNALRQTVTLPAATEHLLHCFIYIFVYFIVCCSFKSPFLKITAIFCTNVYALPLLLWQDINWI